MFHLLQPIFGAPFFDWSLQIFLVEDTILHMKDLRVLPHLCEVRVDHVDDELVLGGAWCRRLVTADAMGMAKEGDRTEVDVDGSGNEIGDKDGDTPRCTQVQGSP